MSWLRVANRRVAEWVYDRFGETCLMDKKERNLRVLEEAIELCQTAGITPEEVDIVSKHVFSRPVGEAHQELAGVFVSLLASFWAHGLDPQMVLHEEIERVLSVPKEVILAKQQYKNRQGITKYGG